MSGDQPSVDESEIPHFENEMKLMKQQGMSQDSIDDIISCIHQDDTMNKEQLSKLKEIVIK